jgi:hypothetical protein
MKHEFLTKLVSMYGRPLDGARTLQKELEWPDTELGRDVRGLVNLNDGLSIFQRSIIVFPKSVVGEICSVAQWNSAECWRHRYMIDTETIFFAEDVFSNQFCTDGTSIFQFDPESGNFDTMASTLEEWARKLCEDSEFYSGSSILQQWEEAVGPLSSKNRLVAKQPFIMGGSYSLSNLMSMDRFSAMDYHGELYQKIKDLPDGSKVVFDVE